MMQPYSPLGSVRLWHEGGENCFVVTTSISSQSDCVQATYPTVLEYAISTHDTWHSDIDARGWLAESWLFVGCSD